MEIFSKIGITAAAGILNVVVLTAALSTYNSGLYSNGRMLHSLALQGNGPKMFGRLGKNGIAVNGVLFSSGLTLIAVALNYMIPGKVFLYLISVATIAGIINWTMILITNLKFRAAKGEEGTQKLLFKVPFFPYGNYITLAYMAMIVILMVFMPDMRYSLYILPVWALILWIGFKLLRQGKTEVQ